MSGKGQVTPQVFKVLSSCFHIPLFNLAYPKGFEPLLAGLEAAVLPDYTKDTLFLQFSK